MSKAEILQEPPKLDPKERREILEFICEIEERDLLNEEKALLDRELENYQQDPKAGSSWKDVETRLRKTSRS